MHVIRRWWLVTVIVTAAAASLGSQSPQTLHFTPTQFYTTYSFAHPPALRIKPGDRVVTKTIDAGGTDWEGKAVSPGGNPQTGPFYVEGAEPDDTLIVSFTKIETNRATGYSGSLLAPYTGGSGGDRHPRRSGAETDGLEHRQGEGNRHAWIPLRSRHPTSSCRSSRCSGASRSRRRARRRSRRSPLAHSAATWITPA